MPLSHLSSSVSLHDSHRFEYNFKFDENRVPREWDKDVDITEIYVQSREKVCDLDARLNAVWRRRRRCELLCLRPGEGFG